MKKPGRPIRHFLRSLSASPVRPFPVRRIFGLLFILCRLGLPVPFLSAVDVGLVLDVTPGYEGRNGFESPDGDNITVTGTLRPWFSMPLGAASELYLSAGLSLEYRDRESTLVPELYHTEFTFHFGQGSSLSAGRLRYADPLGFIAEGLFDGAAWETAAWGGVFSAGAYYTGFLYKRTAYITVSQDELDSYNVKPEYGSLWENYFAPRRVLTALDYTRLLGETVRLSLALLGQFDLNGRETYYSSEYLTAAITVPFKNNLVFDAGGVVELIETSGEDLLLGIAGKLGLSWMPPTAIHDRLYIGGRYSSGKYAGSLTEFRPLTTEPQGQVLRAKFSGLSILETGYTGRLWKTLALDLSFAYFIRNDLGTFKAAFVERPGYFLGGEAFAQFIWRPVSDLSFNLGGGVFLPGLGNAGSGIMWLVNLNIVVALL